jgi:uncharacterized protein
MKFTRKAIIVVFIMVLTIGNFLWAGEEDNDFVIGKQITIKSETLNQEREILVYLPNGYETNDNKYPVIYLLDGGFHFHHATGVVQFLASQGRMPQTILVAIKNIDRNKDFLPTNVEDVPTSGGAEDFLTFISDELIPHIDENYRTRPYRTLIGHSFGGTFTAYTFLEDPTIFDSYIAISPVLHWDEDLLVKKAETALKSIYSKNKYFYMTLGDEPPYVPAIDKFTSMIETKVPEKLEFSYTQMIEETHGSIPHLTMYNGLEKLYDGWGLPRNKFEEGLPALDLHYKTISEKYNYEVPTPEGIINMAGYAHLQKEEFEKAIEVFAENVKRFPESANVYDSLGDAYENNKQLKLAEENYAKACKLADKDDPALNIFETNLQRVQEALKE